MYIFGIIFFYTRLHSCFRLHIKSSCVFILFLWCLRAPHNAQRRQAAARCHGVWHDVFWRRDEVRGRGKGRRRSTHSLSVNLLFPSFWLHYLPSVAESLVEKFWGEERERQHSVLFLLFLFFYNCSPIWFPILPLWSSWASHLSAWSVKTRFYICSRADINIFSIL